MCQKHSKYDYALHKIKQIEIFSFILHTDIQIMHKIQKNVGYPIYTCQKHLKYDYALHKIE